MTQSEGIDYVGGPKYYSKRSGDFKDLNNINEMENNSTKCQVIH